MMLYGIFPARMPWGGSGRWAELRRWALRYAISCAGLLALVYLSIWAFNGFGGLGLDISGVIALTIGTVLAAALGITLMGLAFYSDRVEQDGPRATGNGRGKSIGD